MLAVASLFPAALKFFMGPSGRYVLLGLAFLAWGTYQRVDATRDCEDAELRRQLEESNRQLTIAQQIADAARKRADDSQREMDELRRIADGLAEEISNTGSECAIDDDTRERLLRIR